MAKEKRNIVVTICAIIMCVVFIGTACLVFSVNIYPKLKYNKIHDKAKNLMDAGEFNAAYAALDEIDKLDELSFANLMLGDIIKFGYYEQDNDLLNGAEEIEWIVYNINRDEKTVALISKDILDYLQWDSKEKTYYISFEGKLMEDYVCSYKDSPLKQWIDTDFTDTVFHNGQVKIDIGSFFPTTVSFTLKEKSLEILDRFGYTKCNPTAYASAKGADGYWFSWSARWYLDNETLTDVWEDPDYEIGNSEYGGFRPQLLIYLE